MLSALSVLVGGSLAQPLQFWGLSFVIVSSLELYAIFSWFCRSENKVVGCRV